MNNQRILLIICGVLATLLVVNEYSHRKTIRSIELNIGRSKCRQIVAASYLSLVRTVRQSDPKIRFNEEGVTSRTLADRMSAELNFNVECTDQNIALQKCSDFISKIRGDQFDIKLIDVKKLDGGFSATLKFEYPMSFYGNIWESYSELEGGL